MELVQGVPITEYCDHQRLDTRERLEIFLKVCRAIHHAHQKGIIHRDLKPTNILVANIDGAAVPKVIDFGVAKAIDQKLTEKTLYTQFSQMVGTPLYMSPEQVGIGVIDIDTRSDVYSLGVLLCELLSGSPPYDREAFKRADYDELRRIIREDQPRRPSVAISTLAAEAMSTVAERRCSDPRTLSSALKGELDWLVVKALEKDRNLRYESAAALAEDIQRYLNDEPTVARPPSAVYRVRKFVRRNRALVASVTTVIVALTLGLGLAMAGFLTAQKRLAEVTEEQEHNDILIKVLGDSYGIPWGVHMYGEEQTMRESLHELSAQLQTRTHGRPKLEIRLRQILAYANHRLGNHEQAHDHLRKALHLAEVEYRPANEAVADILTELADETQWHRGKNTLSEDLTIMPFDQTESRARANRALEIYNAQGIDSATKAHALFLMSLCVACVPERGKDAEEYLRGAFRISEDLATAKDSYRKVYAMWDLAEHLIWQRKGGSKQAITLVDEALAMSQRVNGYANPVTAGVIGERGDYYRYYGDQQQALASYSDAWQIFKNIHPPNDPLTHSYGLTLAEIYCLADRHEQAMEVIDQIEEDCRDHVKDSLVRCAYVRGWAHILREEYVAAASTLKMAVQLAEDYLEENHAYALLSRFHLARVLDVLGRTVESQAQYRQVLPLTRERTQLPHARLMELYAHAWTLLHCGTSNKQTLCEALDAANQGLRRAAAWPQYGSGPHLYLAKAIAQYKLAKLEQRDIEQAIETLRLGLQQHEFIPLRPRHKHVPMSRHELELQLTQWLDEQGHEGEAEQVLTEGVELRSKHFGENHPRVALAQLRVARFLIKRGQFQRAEEVLSIAYKTLIDSPRVATVHREQAAKLMVDLCTETGRPEAAAAWRALAESHRQTNQEQETK